MEPEFNLLFIGFPSKKVASIKSFVINNQLYSVVEARKKLHQRNHLYDISILYFIFADNVKLK